MTQPRTLHNKIEKARQLLTDTAISLQNTKLASQLNSLCIDLMVEVRLAERTASNASQSTGKTTSEHWERELPGCI